MKKIFYLLLFICAITNAQVVTKTGDTYSVVDSKNLTIPDGFISPRSYGAVMDGVTDDRTAFVATLAAAETLSKKIWIDSDMFLDVEETGTKSIFLEDNTWIEGNNSSSIIINHLKSNAFIAAISDNITIKNIDFIWDGEYDANFNYSNSPTDNESNIGQLKTYLENERGMTYSGSNPIWRGPINYMYMFQLIGSSNITFNNVKFKTKGETANKFIIGVIKFKEEFASNQTISTENETTVICENVKIKDVEIDGSLMGIQGLVDDLIIDGLTSVRYSDAQNLDGSNVGGDGWMPPPHLIYLNTDGSSNFNTQNIVIKDVYDYGKYIGTTDVRPVGISSNSGYCNSLKLVDNIDNVIVDNYKSFRRDGFADIGSLTNARISNVYSKSTTGIFLSSNKYGSLRFLGNTNNVEFNNITLIDESLTPSTHIMNAINNQGDNNIMTNINLFVKDIDFTNNGPFGFSGSNNTIKGSLTIDNMTSSTTYRGVIYHDNNAMGSDGNNNYDITVNGWREISSDFRGLRSRMLFSSVSNANKNYAKVHDISNNLEIEQVNEIVTGTWTRSEIVSLGSGNEETLSFNVPDYMAIKSVKAVVVSALDGSVTTLSLGTVSGTANNLIADINKSVNSITQSNINETSHGSTRNIYLKGDTNFNSTGQVKVTVDLVRWDTN